MQPIYSYALYLLSSLLLLAAFVAVYLRITPFREIALIRQGNVAAALSLGGAALGFCLTLTASILHNDALPAFFLWALGAMLVQVLLYAALSRALPDMNAAIEANNTGMGALMGVMALAVGALNAACLS